MQVSVPRNLLVASLIFGLLSSSVSRGQGVAGFEISPIRLCAAMLIGFAGVAVYAWDIRRDQAADAQIGAGARVSDGSSSAVAVPDETGIPDHERQLLDQRFPDFQAINHYLVSSMVGAYHDRGMVGHFPVQDGFPDSYFLTLAGASPGYSSYLLWRSEYHPLVSQEYFEEAIEGIFVVHAPVEEVVIQGLEPVEGRSGRFTSITEYRFRTWVGVLTVTVEGNAFIGGGLSNSLVWDFPKIIGFENDGLEK